MSRAPIFAVLGLLWASEGHARCHSIWHYPYPQHCQLARPAAHEAARGPTGQPSATASFVGSAVAAPAPADDKSWFVEITAMPEIDDRVLDEVSHGLGIEKIRELNQARAK